MAEWIALLPLLGILAGWALNEFSGVIKLRREERAAVGRALSDLLTIRRYLHVVKRMTEEASEIKQLSATEQVYLQLIADYVLPGFEGLQERLNEAVKAISGVRPILGFWLGLQQPLEPIKRLRSFATISEKHAAVWNEASVFITDPNSLNEIILEVARLHGRRTYRDIRLNLEENLTLPPDYRNLMEDFKKREGLEEARK